MRAVFGGHSPLFMPLPAIWAQLPCQPILITLLVLMDRWFSSEENFDFIRSKDRQFIAALKNNRLVALSEEDRKKKRLIRVGELNFIEHIAVQGWLKVGEKVVRLIRQVFTNKGGSTGILHLRAVT